MGIAEMSRDTSLTVVQYAAAIASRIMLFKHQFTSPRRTPHILGNRPWSNLSAAGESESEPRKGRSSSRRNSPENDSKRLAESLVQHLVEQTWSSFLNG